LLNARRLIPGHYLRLASVLPFLIVLALLLPSASNASSSASYRYDGDGNRLGTATTSLLWDTNFPLPQLAIERTGSATTRVYGYGRGRYSLTSGGSTYYYLRDALGSTVALTSPQGQEEWTYRYDPFGASTATKVDTAAPANPIQYAGEYLDSTTGLYDLRARDYDPSSGRFLARDPLGGSPNASTYAYADNSPFRYVDPSGLGPVGSNCTSVKCYCYSGGWNTALCGAIAVDVVVGAVGAGSMILEGGAEAGVGEGTEIVDATEGEAVADEAAEAASAASRGSTGRAVPLNLTEQLAMEQAKSNPAGGTIIDLEMRDPRWPASEGWVKMRQHINGVKIHYVYNTITRVADDFKFVS
jgi:RHS repeat-associated protein